MTDKPFRTYEQLVTKLRDEKKLTIPDHETAHVISLLKKYSYFSLVSGYKKLLKAPDGTYLPGTTIDDIFALYRFDNSLRNIFFQAIQIVEKNIKSLLSYSFVKQYGEDQNAYLSPSNYDSLAGTKGEYVRKQEIKKLVSTFFTTVTPPVKLKYIEHQWNAHGNVPLWVSIKAMTFGSVSKMYSLCTSKIQSDVAKEFAGVSSDALVGMLDMLTLVRNVCAHNERLYDFSVSRGRAIQDMPLHKTLGISKTRDGLYKQGKTDLFAAVISLKYLLNADELQSVVNSISTTLMKLFEATKMVPPNKILANMGFPANWMDVAK